MECYTSNYEEKNFQKWFNNNNIVALPANAEEWREKENLNKFFDNKELQDEKKETHRTDTQKGSSKNFCHPLFRHGVSKDFNCAYIFCNAPVWPIVLPVTLHALVAGLYLAFC